MPNATCGSEHGLICDSGQPLAWAHRFDPTHLAPAAPSQQICKRASADQSASSTALWLDRLDFIRLGRRQFGTISIFPSIR
jgi:hypothetical protein